MNEHEINDDVIEETPEEVEEVEQEQPEEAPQPEEPKTREDHPNFREMRKQNQALFERNNQLEQSLKQLQQRLEADAEQFEDPEALRIKKLEAKLKSWEQREQEQEAYRKFQQEAEESHKVLSDIYDDFNTVYTRDNINDFYDKFPSIERRVQQKARILGYEEAAEYAYKRMKEKGYGQKQIEQAVKEARIERNSQKPQRSSALGQVAQAQRESTADYKARLRAETDRIIKGY